MTEIASSRAKDKLEMKLMLHFTEEPYSKTGNLPGKKCDQIIVYFLRETYFQKFSHLFAGHFDTNVAFILHFAI